MVKKYYLKGAAILISYKLNSSEVDCKCDNERCFYTLVDNNLLGLWSLFRAKWGKPVTISSGFRCQTHNASEVVKGSKKSRHTIGSALDLVLPKKDKEEFIALAKKYFPYVIDDYKTFIHVDVRD